MSRWKDENPSMVRDSWYDLMMGKYIIFMIREDVW
jgi:hypothetical protein